MVRASNEDTWGNIEQVILWECRPNLNPGGEIMYRHVNQNFAHPCNGVCVGCVNIQVQDENKSTIPFGPMRTLLDGISLLSLASSFPLFL